MRGIEIPYKEGKQGLHGKVLKALLERVKLSEQATDNKAEAWRKAEQYYMLYKKKNEKDKKVEAKEAQGETDYKSVVMPYSYALLLTAHTYLTNVFLNRDPVFQVQGVDGSGAEKELSLESLLQYQLKGGEMEPHLLVWLLDVLRYGVGFVGNYWIEEFVPRRSYEEVEEEIDGVPTGNMITQTKYERIAGYEGNKLFNILPYDALPDPRVSYMNMQEGEFFGRKFKISWNDMKRRETMGIYFNVDKCRELLGAGAKDKEERFEFMDNMDESQKNAVTGTPDGMKTGQMDAIEIYVDLIPSEWGLDDDADEDWPEKWVFTIVDKKIIIGASPLGYYHNKFPFHVLEAEVDGYKQESRGILEVAAPMNDILTWLFDSHMYNKRQVMNNQFVGDPSALVTKDLENKKPGKFIRLKPSAYGRDVRSIISQLPVSDVTQQNYQDLNIVTQQMQQTVGVNNDVAGQASPSSRRSAAEFRGTTSFSSSRLANMAYFFGITGWRTLCQCLISSTQQLYTVEKKVKVAGDAIKGAQSVTVSPEDIAGEFDVSPVDGTMPIDRMSQAQFWMQVLTATGQDPELKMQFRRSDIFTHMCKLAGLKSIDKFKMQVVSDEELVAMVKKGLIEETGGADGRLQQGFGTEAGGAEGAEGSSDPAAAERGAQALSGLF